MFQSLRNSALVQRWVTPPIAGGIILFVFVITVALVAISGGMQSPEVVGFVVVILLAGFLSGAWAAVLLAVLSFISILILYGVSLQGMLPAPLLQSTPLVSALVILMNIVLITGVVFLTLRGNSRAFRELRTKEQEAGASNRALQELLVSMEARISERTQSAEKARQEAESTRMFLETQAWQASGHAQLGEVMRGEQELTLLANQIIRFLCQFLDAQVGTLYVLKPATSTNEEALYLMGSYAYSNRKSLSHRFVLGDGLVGQAALEKQIISITRLPEDYLSTTSGLVSLTPKMALAAPFLAGGRVVGVIELGTITKFSAGQTEFLNKALESIGLAFSTAQARTQVNELLAQTQQQARELQLREEELRATNDELQEQTQALRLSQQRLVIQQEALESANAELEERASILQEQRAVLDRQNKDLKAAQDELEKKAAELALASKYKSEFLANMSHELRTPLNSLLILAGMLAKNDAGNLTPDQIESAQIIFTSGSDLLMLINDILDLSKVEAGQMQFYFAPMPLAGLTQAMHSQFDPVAAQKNLQFEILLAPGLPETIETDQQRIQQVIKNLLSNAFKFTEKGFVRFSIDYPDKSADLSSMGVTSDQAIVFHVQDSGIGIPAEQQRIVFEAFQQADGSTSRRYGGTGLGLAISRELAFRLGGKIELHSVPGSGSLFSLYLPVNRSAIDKGFIAPAAVTGSETEFKPSIEESDEQIVPTPVFAEAVHVEALQVDKFLDDDRDELRKGDRLLLVIEDDPKFARVVYKRAHGKDFKCLLAADGESGLKLVDLYHPDAILLDLKLPGMSGWQVLDTLKQNPDTRHIPVHILSATEENLEAYKMGAIGFLSKPVSPEGLEDVFEKLESFIARRIKSLLVVEDDDNLRHSVRQLLGGSDVRISEASHGSAALDLLRTGHFDCMILDLNLPDMNGYALLNQINADEALSRCPVIIYTGKALTEEENAELMKYADSVVIKGVKSSERLLDETALFLHRVVADMPEEKRSTIKRLHHPDAALDDRHILVVDDDMRSAFALSKVLTEKGLKVSIARSGQKALEMLAAAPAVDLVLMDIMMPEMDGYETMRRIRAQARFRTLPILALTAKAMKGDREKCIVAGASDYLSKPVDVDRLFSMLRVWLHR